MIDEKNALQVIHLVLDAGRQQPVRLRPENKKTLPRRCHIINQSYYLISLIFWKKRVSEPVIGSKLW